VLGEPLVRQRDGLAVPAIPVSRLIAGYEDDRLAPGVSNANSIRISVVPDDGGRSSFMSW
jgi:hypothetical protein